MTPHQVLATTAKAFGVTPESLTGNYRTAYISRARYAAMWMLREVGLSYPEVGMLLQRNHTTVLHGTRKAQKLSETNPIFRGLVKSIRKELTQ